MILLQHAAGGSYVVELVRTLLALVFVGVVAFLALRWLGRRGLGGAASGPSETLRVLRRLPLDARSSLYVVRAGARVLLLGTGEGASPRLIAELDPAGFETGALLAAPKEGGQ